MVFTMCGDRRSLSKRCFRRLWKHEASAARTWSATTLDGSSFKLQYSTVLDTRNTAFSTTVTPLDLPDSVLLLLRDHFRSTLPEAVRMLANSLVLIQSITEPFLWAQFGSHLFLLFLGSSSMPPSLDFLHIRRTCWGIISTERTNNTSTTAAYVMGHLQRGS